MDSTKTAPAPRAAAVIALAQELRELLGETAVSTEIAAREAASVDGAPMSPILAAQLPLGLADLVVYVSDPDTVPAIISAAVAHGVPITPRGKGTGNYGQAIPLHGGLVLDLSPGQQGARDRRRVPHR